MTGLRKKKRVARPNRINMQDQWFGYWKAIEPYDYTDRGGNTYWKCVCACGTESVSQGQNLRNGRSQSCGRCRAGARNFIRQIGVWVARFTDSTHPEYSQYGGKGRCCDPEFKKKDAAALTDMFVSRLFGKRNGQPHYAAIEFGKHIYEIVLVNPDGELSFKNLKLEKRKRPMRPRNRRYRKIEYMGQEMSISAFCRETGLHRSTVYRWLESGRTPNELLASIVTNHILEQ